MDAGGTLITIVGRRLTRKFFVKNYMSDKIVRCWSDLEAFSGFTGTALYD